MSDSSAYESYREKSLGYFLSNQFQEAVKYFAKEAAQAEQQEHWHTALYCRLTNIRYRVLLAEYEDTMKELEAIKENKHFKTILKKDSFLKAFQIHLVATIFYYKGSHYQAWEVAKQIDLNFKGQKNSLSDIMAQVLSWLLIGRCKWRLRAYSDAFWHYIKAIECLVMSGFSGNEINFFFGKVYNLIGALLIEIQEIEKALQYLELSKSIYESLGAIGSNHSYRANLFGDLCDCLLRLKNETGAYQVHEAEMYLDEAVIIYDEVHKYGRSHRDIATTHKLRAFLEKRKSPLIFSQLFVEEHEKNIRVRREVFGTEQHFSIAHAYNQLAKYFLENRRLEEGLNAADKAIDSATEKHLPAHKASREELPLGRRRLGGRDKLAQQYRSFSPQLIIAMYLKVELLYQQYLVSEEDIHYLNEAVAILEEAVAIKETYFRQKTRYEDRLLLVKHARPIHETAIKMLFRIQNKSDEELAPDCKDTLFRIVQESKAYLLLEEMLANDQYLGDLYVKRTNGEAPSLSRLFETLLDSSAKFFQEENEEQHLSDWLRNNMQPETELGVEEREEGISDTGRQEEPNALFTEGYGTVCAVQDGLKDESAAIISYFVGKEKVYAVVLSRASFKIIQICRKRDELQRLREQVKVLGRLLNEDVPEFEQKPFYGVGPMSKFKQVSFYLYQILLEPIFTIFPSRERVYIIPDDFLWDISFDVLLTRAAEDDSTYEELPYFINDCLISYHFSIALLYQQHLKNKKDESNIFTLSGCLVVDVAGESNLRSFSDDYLRAEEYNSSSDFVKGLEEKRQQLIIIDAHGKIDLENFSPSIKLRDDSRLQLGDIIDMKGHLDCELLILNVCFAGGGGIHVGEGILSFPRVFYQKGARNVIYSQLKIPSDVSEEIVKSLIKDIEKKNQPVAQILRQIKRSAIREKLTPDQWAGLVFLGEQTRVLKIDRSSSKSK